MEHITNNPIFIKELNPLQQILVKTLEKNGPMTRDQMVNDISRARTTIYDNLSTLIDRNMIKKISRQVNARGRPVVFFKLIEN